VFDLALVLKTIPCLEQVDKTAGQQILENLPARYLLVSFPGRSLGGRAKGMIENYEAHFRNLIKGKDWKLQRFEFQSELAFLIDKTEFTEFDKRLTT
jgi:16S rRNA (guanine(1405)-N(7))-methyltransferase